jgi:hypothetical protein
LLFWRILVSQVFLGLGYPWSISRDLHVHIAERQYEFLRAESALTGLPMAELVRRALDHTYFSTARPRLRGWQASVGWWRHPDAAIVGRAAGSRS